MAQRDNEKEKGGTNMKNRLSKRLSAWLLTLIMALSLLPAAALADEVDDDPSPPAPQEDYGYVRLVFSEGEQIDLYHGKYITECSPTAEVFGNADEDFIANGEYAALYYEGRLYHKAALDGVSIDADAVLPAEDFALVPMGDDLTTLGEEHEDKTPPAVEVVDPEDESSGSDKTMGTPPSTEPESKEEDKTTEDEGGSSGSGYNIGDDTQPQGPGRVPVMQAPMLAAATDDKVTFVFHGPSQSITLRNGQYINECKPGASVITVDSFIDYPNYAAFYYGGVLYLQGDYNGVYICLPNKDSQITLVGDLTMSNSSFPLYVHNYKTAIDLSGHVMTLNVEPIITSDIYGIKAADVEITGKTGSILNINTSVANDNHDHFAKNVWGIKAENEVRILDNAQVNLNMNGGGGLSVDAKVAGIDAKTVEIRGSSKVNIEVNGHIIDLTRADYYKKTGAEGGRINTAIAASSLNIQDSSSLDILSHNNVISDICLGSNSGDALYLNTSGHLNITNEGKFIATGSTTLYPKYNIYASHGNINILCAGDGVTIDSLSQLLAAGNGMWAPGSSPWDIFTTGSITLGDDMTDGGNHVDRETQHGIHRYIEALNGSTYTVRVSDGRLDSSGSFIIDPSNDVYLVPKGKDLTITAPEDQYGAFLCWYDAETSQVLGETRTITLKNVSRNMTVAPAYNPMKDNYPTLSDYQYNRANTYRYTELTYFLGRKFTLNYTPPGDSIVLVSTFPKDGTGLTVAKDLKGKDCRDVRNGAHLLPDKSMDLNNNHFILKNGEYRMAVYHPTSQKWYFSKPISLNFPPIPPKFLPATPFPNVSLSDDFFITLKADMEDTTIWYRAYYENTTMPEYQKYTAPFSMPLRSDLDILVDAYTISDGEHSPIGHARYSTIPDIPKITLPDGSHSSPALTYHYYRSLWLKAEPQYNTETRYCYDKREPNANDSIMEDGALTITDKGVGQKQPITFCARKSFLLGSNTYTKWSNSQFFYVEKVSTIPQPVVTLKVDGTEIAAPASGSTIYFNDSVTATIKKSPDWPLDVVPGSQTVNSAFSNAASQTFKNTLNCEFKSAVVDSSGQYTGEYSAPITYKFQKIARNKLWPQNCTATVDGETVMYGDLVAAGNTVTIKPIIPAGYTFKGWYSTIDDMPITDNKDGTYSFTMPDQSITIKAILYAQEYDSVEVILGIPNDGTSVDTAKVDKVTPSQIRVDLQWYKDGKPYHGNFVGKEAYYRIHITCHAAEGAIFSNSVEIKVNKSPDKGRPVTKGFALSEDKKTLEFDAWLVYAPEITIPLHDGDSTKPKAADCILPPGLTVETLTWNADGTIKELKIKDPHYTFGDTICRFSFGEGWATINGQRCQGEFPPDIPSGIDTSRLVFKNISIPTVSKGVEVRGTITSYGSASEAVTVTLLQGTSVIGSPQVLTGASGSAPYSQNYSFPAVPAGTYTLKVEKKGHAPWTEKITVGTDNITGKNVTIYLYGDINGDGLVKANDKTILARYLADWPGYETLPVYPAVADLNCDGFIKANDKTILARYLANWPGYETLPKI